jgi:hypothetical protein
VASVVGGEIFSAPVNVTVAVTLVNLLALVDLRDIFRCF